MGRDEKTTVAAITSLLGPPGSTGDINTGCQIAPDGAFHQLVVWDALLLEFTGKSRDGHDLSLSGWTARPGKARIPFHLPDGVTLQRTRGVDLLRKLPNVHTTPGPGTNAGPLLVDSDGVYFGLDRPTVDATIDAAGFPLEMCEWRWRSVVSNGIEAWERCQVRRKR